MPEKDKDKDKDTLSPNPASVGPLSPVNNPLLQKEEKKPDETIPGGKYLVNGVLVDCNGNPIKE